ncbi:GPI2-domain-containing protein, partial [Caulochytrium protostelioides]
PPFQKRLYVRQPYPDNYTADSFLQELRRNDNVQPLAYTDLVRSTMVVTQRLSSVMSFVGIFHKVATHQISVRTFVGFQCALIALGFWRLTSRDLGLAMHSKRFRVFKGGWQLGFVMLGLAPILKTLTKEISPDTIWAMFIALMGINMLLHDYNAMPTLQMVPSQITSSECFSINAGIFASVLLASRLDTNLEVFGLLLLAVILYALAPIYRRVYVVTKPGFDGAMTAVCITLTTGLWWDPENQEPLIYYGTVLLLITFVCPLLLMRSQIYKYEISGPWDEAKI